MKTITKYLNNRKNKIIRILEKPSNAYTPATTHNLRIEIKKLQAFLEVIEFCSKEFDRKKILKPFKIIFREAGKIRELQVEDEMLKKYFVNNLLTDYRDNLRIVHLKAQKDFFSILTRKYTSGLKKQFRKISVYLDHITEKKVNKYIDSQRKEIERLTRSIPLEASKVHELRKRLKKFNYNRKCLQKDNHNKPQSKENCLSDLMGKWHDHQITLEHLGKAIATENENLKEVKQLEEVRIKITTECEELFKQVNQAIQESEYFPSNQIRNRKMDGS